MMGYKDYGWTEGATGKSMFIRASLVDKVSSR